MPSNSLKFHANIQIRKRYQPEVGHHKREQAGGDRQPVSLRWGASGTAPRRSRSFSPSGPTSLLDLRGRASLGELLGDGLGIGLGDAFLDRFRRAIHQVLGLLQPEARDLPHHFDHVHLVVAG